MNRIYRTLWSVTTQSWQAVPETAKTAGKKSKSSAGGAIASFALSWVLTGGANAQAPPAINQLPTGGSVVRGTATITQTATAQAAAMTVNQTSQRAVVNWNTFNIGSAASVNFVQPNAQAVTLNRVNDSNPSQIFGRMTSNGQVVLTNANGIYFAPGSSVDVGAITATTHSITDDNFMSGKYVFERNGATGKIINEGNITAALAGYVALLAPEVQNSGVVVARAGTVAMAAGETITLNIDGAGSLAGITTTPSAIASLIENKQAVQAPDGQIILSAVALNKLQAGVIKNSGNLEANSLVSKGGKIYLEGDDITLTSTSKLEAKGATGGGTVLVGGDWQGSGDLRQATKVTMEAGATIDASATDKGDGGKVVLWSDIHNADSQTKAHGSIKSEAGPNGGDGGKVETSGHYLNVDSIQVSTQSQNSATGEWLLDPWDITIAASGATGTAWTSGTYTSAATSTILASNITSALSTSNVVVSTGGTAGDGNGSGNITVSTALSWSTNKALTLIASGGVSGSNLATIAMTGGGGLVINQAGTSTYIGAISGNGSVTKDGAGTLTLSGSNTYTGDTTINAGTLAIGGLNGKLNNGTYSGNITNNGIFQYSSSSAQTLSGVMSGNGQVIKDTNASTLTMSGANTFTGNVATSAGSIDLTFAPSFTTDVRSYSNTGTNTITLRGNFSQSGILSGSGNYAFSPSAGSTITLNGANTFTGIAYIYGSVKLGTSSTISSGTVTATPVGLGSVSLEGTGNLDLNGQDITLASGKSISSSGNRYTGIKLSNSTGTAYWRSPIAMRYELQYNVSAFSIDVAANATLEISGSQSSDTAGQGLIFTKLGAGTLKYTTPADSSGQYFSNWILSAGVVDVNSTTAQGPTTAGPYMTISSGAELKIGQYNVNSLWTGYGNNSGPGLTNNGTLTIYSNSTSAYAMNASSSLGILGSGALVFTGGGYIKLGNFTNRFTGTTTITAGTTVETVAGINSLSSVINTNPVSILGNLKINGASSGAFDFTTKLTGTGNLEIASGLVGLYADNSGFTGNTTIDSGATMYAGSMTSSNAYKPTVAGPITDNGTLYFYSAGTAPTAAYSIANNISGTGGITVDNNNADITLTGTLGYNGNTNIKAGNLTLNSASAFNTSGTFTTTGTGGTLVYKSPTNSTFSGQMSGGLKLTVDAGAGSLTLTANNTRTGTTTITSGSLFVGDGGTSGQLGNGTITNNASLIINRSDAYSLSALIGTISSGTGNVSISSGGALTIDRAISLSGTNSLIDIFSTGNLTLGAVTLANTGTSGGIKFRANGGVTFSSASSILNASGTSGSITVSAGSNLLAGDTTAGYDITMTSASSSAINTSATGTVNIFQGNANTTALSSKITSTAAGGTSTKKYKTYGSTYASLSSSVSGTRNFYYRANPSGVTVSGVTASKPYDGTTNAVGFITGGTVAGLSADETGLTGLGLVFATADFSDPNAGTGKNLTLGGVSLNNAAWSISGLSATLGGGSSGTISKANLTLSGTKVYDGTTTVAGSQLLATGVHNESFTVTGSGAAGNLTSADVQATSTALASVTGLAVGVSNGINTGDASNYNLLSTTGSTFSVSRATATLTGLKVYDANNTLTGTQLGITGVTVGGTTQTLNYSGSAALYDPNVATTNNYVTSSNLVLANNGSFLANNYVLPAFTHNANNSATVSAATATVTASKTYDSGTTLSAGQVTITGLSVGGAAQTLNFTGTATLSDANVASVNKYVNTSGMTLADGSTGIASNYVLPASAYNVTRNTATITRFALTATDVNTGTSVYGDPMAPGSVTFANKFGTDDVNAVVTVTVPAGSLSGSGLAKVGNYFQSASTSLTGTKASNYSFSGLTSQSANYVITPLPLTGATISAASSDYGSPLTAGTVTFTNALLGDQVTTSASVNTNILSGAQLPVVGTYTQTTSTALTGADASNYVLSTGITGAANYTINAKALTINVPGASRMYDSSTSIYPTAPASVLGVIGSDQVLISAGNVTGFVDKNVGTNKAVTYTGFAFAGSDASNYVLSANPASTADITAKPITVAGITAIDKVYNGSTSASLNIGAAALTSGANANTDNKVYSADNVALDASAVVGTFANANVGTAKPVTITGLALSGTDAGNYIVTDASNATASITPKALTVSGTSVANKTYDGTTSARLSNGTLVGVISTDLAHVSLTESGDFSDKNAGQAKQVTANGVLSGTAASNYLLIQPSGLTADIYKAGLTVSAVDAEKIFGNDNPALNVTLSGFVGGETLATSGVTGSGLATTSATINTNPGAAVINAAIGTLAADNYDFTRFINGTLTIKSIGGLNNTEVASLISGSQLAALSSTQLNGFTASQLQVFSAQQLSSLSASQLMGLTATQISSLSNVQLLALSPAQISALKPEQLSALTPTQISLLTGNRAMTFSAEQVLSLSPSQIAAISPTVVAGMTTAELVALSDAQLQALTPTQLAVIAPANFAAFTPAQIMAMSIAQVQNLSPEQLATFSPAQIASLNAAELAYFDARQLAAIGIFPKVETPVAAAAVIAPPIESTPATQEVANVSGGNTVKKDTRSVFEAPIPVLTEVTAANASVTEMHAPAAASAPEQTAALTPRALQNLLLAPITQNSARTSVLAITILNSAEAKPTTAGIAFEQDADTVSLRFTSAPTSVPPMSDKVVFRDKLVTFMVATSSGVMVEFEGSVVNDRMVIVAPSSMAKRIARTEMSLVLAAAITSLGKENRVMLASLTGVVLDLR
jgi:filamentous hemagglutinin family protein